jgi:hypothetical protein
MPIASLNRVPTGNEQSVSSTCGRCQSVRVQPGICPKIARRGHIPRSAKCVERANMYLHLTQEVGNALASLGVEPCQVFSEVQYLLSEGVLQFRQYKIEW